MTAEDFEEEEDECCTRCGCCSTMWERCDDCGGQGGRDGDELMEDDPLWYGPDDYEECDTCNGKGGWYICIGGCDENGKHKEDKP